MSVFEEKKLELTRRGDSEKVKWMNKIDSIIMPSQVERIQQNDKSILRELVLPKWVSWDFLYEWAQSRKPKANGRQCILCNESNENGIDFKEKYICENCYIKIKNLK